MVARRTGARRVGAAMAVITASMAIGGFDRSAGAADLIPDEGLPAEPVEASPLVSERTEILQSGVIGRDETNDSFPNTDANVLAFAEHEGIVYVGGKFTAVQRPGLSNGDQPYLAAFDRNTGAWIETFRPALDGNVWDLKITDDGDLLVAGQFTNVDGQANTAALARIDLVTGSVDPQWRVGIVLTGSTQRALVRALDIEGDDLYVGGNFTRITGVDGDEKQAGRIARVSLATGNVDGAFLPDIDGIVFDIDADGDRVYTAGNFFYTNGVWTIGLSITNAADGQVVPDLEPWVRTYVRNTLNSYQQAVLVLGDEVWQTGSQHNTQAYARSDHSLIRSFVTDPWGDGQALTYNDGILYQGSHANGETFMYTDATRYPVADSPTPWTSKDPVRWMGAFDAENHVFLDWYPQVGTANGEGAWELFIDSTDCLWAGGDFNRGSYDGAVARYVQGFAKFCATDTTPPAPPTNPSAALRGDGGINLAWDPSPGDDRGGEVRYEVLKNDRVLASFISITTFADREGTIGDRYFVRAMDTTGNRSATTAVFEVADEQPPTTPSDLTAVLEESGDVTLGWGASTDNVGVVDYQVLRNGEEIAVVPAEVVTAAVADDLETDGGWIVDPSGNDTGDGAGAWHLAFPEASTRNETVVQPGSVTSGSLAITTQGAAGNTDVDNGVESVQSPPYDVPAGAATLSFDYFAGVTNGTAGDFFRVTVQGAGASQTVLDLDFTGVTQPAAWTPVTVDVSAFAGQTVTLLLEASDAADIGAIVEAGVDTILFEGTESLPLSYVVPAPAPGSHWYQVRARDAAGNESFKTPSVRIDVEAPDSTPPSTPQNLGAVVEATGDVTLTWDASTDDTGVTEYQVLRNGVEIAVVATPGYVVPAPAVGSHWYQVRARDAAGNESFKTPSVRVDIAPPDTTRPSTPQNLVAVVEASGDVTLTWDAATDDVGVTEYQVLRNGVEIGVVANPGFVVPAPAVGSHWYQVLARDAAGNESFKTSPVRVDIAPPDTTSPSTPQNLGAVVEASGDVTLTWDASTDDVGVVDYQVLRNGVEIGVVAAPGFVVPAPAPGSHWYQVRARDAAGNESFKTPSVRVDIAAPDTQAPTTPQNLDAVVEASGDVTLSWDAATDDVGVVDYQVLRNGVEIAVVPTPGYVVPAPAVGSHWYQVRARDAAGNEGNKTAPVRVDIV